VAVVTQIKKPSNTSAKADRAKYKQQASREIETASRESVLDISKASAELDINEELLIRQ
jgi:hypothetical protein